MIVLTKANNSSCHVLEDSYFFETHFDIFLPSTSRSFFKKIFIAQKVYTVCKRMNYKIVPLTSLKKYLHYGTSGTEEYV